MLPGPGPDARDDLARLAAAAAERLLTHVPDTGDPATGRRVDAFVDEAVAALRLLADRLEARDEARDEARGEALSEAPDGAGR
ncbi:hypothetical protein [Lapillicoccus jejuensis]|uniref:Uncharacterized protein n=1 Tax=Lapillicoccus jejuensis TaxID=402171 RepID=A0A542E2N7_9MICO|nr:hypothetical protein [Lapillicoccus jejuensis]TQJ09585.1 hypothetical protein FB458_2697 [Lapillicoccus jejuensis]